MAEEPQVIRGINWREAFPFTNLFRAFRIAIHPSKLVLAFLGLLSIYVGGRVLDALWVDRYRAVPSTFAVEAQRPPLLLALRGVDDPEAIGEIRAFELYPTAQFQNWRQERRAKAADNYAALLREMTWLGLQDPAKAGEAARNGQYTRQAKWWAKNAYRDARDSAKKAYDQQVKDAEDAYNKANKDTAQNKDQAERNREAALTKAHAQFRADVGKALAQAMTRIQTVVAVKGQGPFDAFLAYETFQINKVWQGVLGGNWLGGMPGGVPIDGVLISTYKFFTVAPGWALRHHPLYFVLFGALFLIVWSLFGGAISRIAAVHVADEGRKLSIRQGLGFALSKFLSFISAPLIPLLIVVGIGIIVAVGGLVFFGIPYVSAYVLEFIGGVLFFLALAGGFVMTLVLLGTIGGFNLMYPTIAVEGSDSFDAISRSFSYVYAKPWRMLFYTLVAIAYGALTYLFVRLFLWLMLVLTQYFTGLFVYRDAPTGDEIWGYMFPSPAWGSLPYELNTLPLSSGGAVASVLISIWVYVAISMLGAFAISMYFSLNTIIYYLMRREVDATEMDDVYLEQPEEEFAETRETPPAAEPQPVATTAPAPAAETPSAEGGAKVYPAPTPTPETPPQEKPPESGGTT